MLGASVLVLGRGAAQLVSMSSCAALASEEEGLLLLLLLFWLGTPAAVRCCEDEAVAGAGEVLPALSRSRYTST